MEASVFGSGAGDDHLQHSTARPADICSLESGTGVGVDFHADADDDDPGSLPRHVFLLNAQPRQAALLRELPASQSLDLSLAAESSRRPFQQAEKWLITKAKWVLCHAAGRRFQMPAGLLRTIHLVPCRW